MIGRVYLVTNTVNGKQYVGQTITKYSKKGHGHAIRDAYKKYGRKCFTYETIVDNITCQNLLDFLEQFWIKVMGCQAPNGYNLESGGKFYKTVTHKPNLGKKASAETRAKMSEGQKAYWSSLAVHPNKGRKASEETRLKMSKARTGRKQSEEERQMRSRVIKKWHQKRKEQACRTEH